jgi:multiple sugar transport system substrate-binding protein
MGPLLAAASVWAERRPGVAIEWSARPLAAFNDQPIETLARRFDLLVIDHPFVGTAAATGCLAPVDGFLSGAVLAERALDSIGSSHESYAYEGRQWALAVDAACQVAVVRDDLLDELGQRPPASWEDVVAFAEAKAGRVAIPLSPTDAICSVLTLCANFGAPAAAGALFFSDPKVGREALALLARLLPALHPESLDFSPPLALERMRGSDEIVYMPLAFGYTNYSRPAGGRRPRLRFLDIVSKGRNPAGSLLGGAGLAVSSTSRHQAEATEFAAWVSGREAQASVVFPAGGQPASRSAWLDATLDESSGFFFSGTRATIEAAQVRPRTSWWPGFQEEAGHVVTSALRERRPPAALADVLERLYRLHSAGRYAGKP